jgi:hypothetical protein
MHFLLLLLCWVLDRLIPHWRDGLTMAARADGRVEHHSLRPALWDGWRSRGGRRHGKTASRTASPAAGQAPTARASARSPDSGAGGSSIN